jgi:hypothetical protein
MQDSRPGRPESRAFEPAGFGKLRRQGPAILISAILMLPGCAAPPVVNAKAETILRENCLALFQSFYYQNRAQANELAPYTYIYLALADDPNSQVCALGAGRDEEDPLMGELFVKLVPAYQKAYSNCEAAKKNTAISSPCRLFARNNDIIWDFYAPSAPPHLSAWPTASLSSTWGQ